MTQASRKIAPRRGLLLPLVISLMTIVVLGGTSFAQSEIDAYDRAVGSQSKESALSFLHEFRSSHLVGDLIESLRPDVAREVCASLQGGGPGAVRRACSSLPRANTAQPEQARVGGRIATQNVAPGGSPVAAVPQPMTDEKMMSSGIGEVSMPEKSGATSSALLSFVAPSTTLVPSAGMAPAPTQTAAVPGFRIQLLSTKSATETKEGWRQLQDAYPDLLGALQFEVVEVNLGAAEGVGYRGFAGPLTDWDEANMLCTVIRSRAPDSECFVAAH
jgi:hypothetical protein